MTTHSDFPERSVPFEHWIADSRLVDAANTPLPVYPRTDTPISVEGSAPLHFTFTTPDAPASAAPAYLAMRNPYVVWQRMHADGLTQAGYVERLRSKGFDSIVVIKDTADAIAPDMTALRDIAVQLIVFHPEQVRMVHEVEREARARREAASRLVPSGPVDARFAAFMAGSRVVHADGSPLVCYHGTAQAFDQFDPAHAGKTFRVDKEGIFFAENPTEGLDADTAATVASFNRGAEQFGQNIRPVFLAIRNPLVKAPIEVQWPYEGIQRIGGTKLFDSCVRAELFAQARAGGHDGLYFPFEENGALQGLWVALRPDQILSVFHPIAIGQPIAYTPALRQPRPAADPAAPGMAP
ncbi:hypothetical protein [Cupriavidus sp. TMH.W2]|uniref:ADP-ribosyltransferase-containing protein n=1 Tax=Cupriavidus sp. TMH.W2 TaxID=3434465 RepID=UPI003D77B2FE